MSLWGGAAVSSKPRADDRERVEEDGAEEAGHRGSGDAGGQGQMCGISSGGTTDDAQLIVDPKLEHHFWHETKHIRPIATVQSLQQLARAGREYKACGKQTRPAATTIRYCALVGP